MYRLAVRDFVEDHESQFLQDMRGWIRDMKIVYKEDVTQGLENAPSTFARMLVGGTFGKTLVQVSDDPTKSFARL